MLAVIGGSLVVTSDAGRAIRTIAVALKRHFMGATVKLELKKDDAVWRGIVRCNTTCFNTTQCNTISCNAV